MPDVYMRRFVGELTTACQARRVANGAKTDIGQRVHPYRTNLQAEELPAIVIVPGEASALEQRADSALFERVVTLEASVLLANDEMVREDMLHDLWVAVHAARENMKKEPGFKRVHVTRMDTTVRDEGSKVVGASLELSVVFFARCDTLE